MNDYTVKIPERIAIKFPTDDLVGRPKLDPCWDRVMEACKQLFDEEGDPILSGDETAKINFREQYEQWLANNVETFSLTRPIEEEIRKIDLHRAYERAMRGVR